jgi:4-amino-4-deoxy-L-arabinose transferase-like glycosyltransferase
VTESLTTIPKKPGASTMARIGWAVLILATLYVCYFSHLGAIGFVGPDEPRYAWIARDMAETGDWVTPRLYGKPWFEKPPLYYWGAAVCFKLFGVSETAARLPSAISALLATVALAWLAWRLYGAETARWLLLLLPTTVGMIGFSHAAATDMPFSGMLTIAMVSAAVVLRLVPVRAGGANPAPANSSTPWVALVLFGFFLGLAVLAKGPAGIILCGGAVFFWAIFTKRWRDAFRLFHPAAITAFCLTTLPWYVLCARRNPDFFRIFIIEHNFKRYLTPEFQHIQPFWFYVPVVLIAVLPWTGMLLWCGVFKTTEVIRGHKISPSAAFFMLWAMFCLVFFSTSQSKLPGYVLPAIPAISICVVRIYVGKAPSRRLRFRIVQYLAAISFLGVALVLGIFARTSHQPSHVAAGAASLIMALIGGTNLILGIFGPAEMDDGLTSFMAGLSVLPLLLALLLSASLLPSFFFEDPSGRSIANALLAKGIPAKRVFVRAMRRGQQYSLSFYLHQEIRSWDQQHPTEGYLLTDKSDCKYLIPETWDCGEVPFDLQSTGRFLFHVMPAGSVAGAPGGGKLE